MLITYDHISANKRKTMLLVLAFPLSFCLLLVLIFYGLAFLAHDNGVHQVAIHYNAEGLPYVVKQDYVSIATENLKTIIPITFGAVFVWVIVSYFFGGKMLLSFSGASKLEKKDNPEVYRLVENLAISRGLPTPSIYVIPDESLNAFATGRDPEHAVVALTTGIVRKLNKVELEGVLAHELAHIENRDITLMLIAVAGISFFTIIGGLVFRSIGRTSGRKGKGVGIIFMVGVVFLIFGYLVAPLIRLALSRNREYLADSTAALITRNPGALASALEKISADSRVEALDKQPSMAVMCIETPLASQHSVFGLLSGITATHPPVVSRIAALRQMDSRGA